MEVGASGFSESLGNTKQPPTPPPSQGGRGGDINIFNAFVFDENHEYPKDEYFYDIP
jgi:hypothetical protein